MRGGFIRQGGDVQAAEDDEDTDGAIAIGQGICAFRVGDVDLNRDQVQALLTVHSRAMLHVLIDDHRFIVRPEIRGEGCQAERRKQGVLDWSPVRAGRLGQGGEDELDAQASPGLHVGHAPVLRDITNYFVL